MTAQAFRKDEHLQAAGYNLYVGAAVNVLVAWPLWGASCGRPWPPWLALPFPVALVGLGLLVAVLNDNRVQKMQGRTSPRPILEAGRFWLPPALIAVVLATVLVVRGPAAYVRPVGLLLVGAGYLTWGIFSISEFRWLGAILVGAGAIAARAVHPDDILIGLPSREVLVVWVVFMGVLWVPFGAYINRKYVHEP